MQEPKKAVYIYEETNYFPGTDTFVDSVADNGNAVVFEDDERTGYFYAVDGVNSSKILDARHIYNVDSLIDKDRVSILEILWSEDESIAFLSINGYYHALFDFKNKAGYCRNGFPDSGEWCAMKQTTLTDEMLETIIP
ncbi:DUF2251 domain-containing protein [Mucilaginibacter sp. CSA2-8R]|uniref:DUF2251 domain-containing protein n=1 Tax=Mucilaginibacter sp. CSA2-8R TaxID=3141542 RepID=UPI00315DA966